MSNLPGLLFPAGCFRGLSKSGLLYPSEPVDSVISHFLDIVGDGAFFDDCEV